MSSHPCVAPDVRLGYDLEIMCQAVHFNCDTRGFAEEVEDKRSERVLLSEPQPFRALLKDTPEADFRRAHVLPQLSSLGD